MTNVSENIHWQKFLNESDEEAFSHIYKHYVSTLYAYGLSLGFTSDICMDAIQDLFYKLYIRKKELRHVSDIHFYLLRSFKNRLLDMHKREKNMQPLDTNLKMFPIEVSVSEHIENEEERAILKQKVEELLCVLTNRQREAVYLRYMQNMEYDAIAMMMEMNPESVRKLVYRALETIRKHVGNTSVPLFTLLIQLFGAHLSDRIC